jgi:hypothetical protein
LPPIAFKYDGFTLNVNNYIVIEKVNFIDFNFSVLNYQASHHRRRYIDVVNLKVLANQGVEDFY